MIEGKDIKLRADTARSVGLGGGVTELALRDTEVAGLVLRVFAGSRSYYVKKRMGAKRLTIKLGSAMEMTLAQARTEARAMLDLIRQGIDPRKQIGGDQDARTFAMAATEYLTDYDVGKLPWQRKAPSPASIKSEHLDIARSTSAVGTVDVQTFGRKDAAELMKSVRHLAGTSQKRTVGSASRVFRRELFWATIDANPFASIESPAGSHSRARFLDPSELSAVWHTAGERGDWGRMVRLLMVLPLRHSLARLLTWDQIDLEAGIVTFVGDDLGNKSGKRLRLPLSPMALDILGPRGTGYVFRGRGGDPVASGGNVKARLDKTSGVTDWVLHDLRRSFSTLLGDGAVELDGDAVERLLMHKRGGIAGIYNRSGRLEAMRAVALQWDRMLVNMVGLEANSIVEIRA